MSQRRVHRLNVTTIDGDSRTTRPDAVAVEEPLELRVNGEAYTTTMRTPGHDIELAHGLLAADGIIVGPDDVASMRYCAGSVRLDPEDADEDAPDPAVLGRHDLPLDLTLGLTAHDQNTYNVLDIALATGRALPPERRRASLTTASCGVCGTATIELLRGRPTFDLTADSTRVRASTIASLPDKLRDAQRTFAATGGLHAAGLFTSEGTPLVVREDVGRHNAVDKVLGWALLNGRRPASGTVLFVSGRTSFELAQKAVLAGVPVLAGVSAPSSLAVEVASEFGLTLIGFVRGARLNVYTHPNRISSGAAQG